MDFVTFRFDSWPRSDTILATYGFDFRLCLDSTLSYFGLVLTILDLIPSTFGSDLGYVEGILLCLDLIFGLVLNQFLTMS